MPSDTSTDGTYRYCVFCDEQTAEWKTGPEGEDVCPRCGASMHKSKESYISEMVRWLGDRLDWDENEIREFLVDHGNPGKGQALGIIRREGLRDSGGVE